MPEDGQYGRNMSHVLAGLIKRVVVYSNTYGSFENDTPQRDGSYRKKKKE